MNHPTRQEARRERRRSRDFGNKPAQYLATFLLGLVFSIGFSGCVLPMVSTVTPRQLGASAFALLFSFIQGALTAGVSLIMGRPRRRRAGSPTLRSVDRSRS